MKTSTNKVLTFVVVLLLLVNIALVIFMVNGRNNHHSGQRMSGRNDPFDMMVKELNMTEDQKKQCQGLREAHFNNIRPLLDSVRAAKSSFFALVKDSAVTDSILTVYSSRITSIQTEIDKMTFAHFVRVRKLFDPAQQLKFDDFVQKMMQRGRRDSTSNNNHRDK